MKTRNTLPLKETGDWYILRSLQGEKEAFITRVGTTNTITSSDNSVSRHLVHIAMLQNAPRAVITQQFLLGEVGGGVWGGGCKAILRKMRETH